MSILMVGVGLEVNNVIWPGLFLIQTPIITQWSRVPGESRNKDWACVSVLELHGGKNSMARRQVADELSVNLSQKRPS